MESVGVVRAKTLIAEEAATNARFRQILPGLITALKSDATLKEPPGTCTITGDVVMSLWQYLLRLSSIGDWKIDPNDRTSLIPSDYVPTIGAPVSLDSNAIRVLGFTNSFLSPPPPVQTVTNQQGQVVTVAPAPATLTLMTKLSQLESAFDAHSNQAAINDARSKGVDLALVSYRPLREFGKDSAGQNFFSTAGSDATNWRIVRARRVRPVTNAWGTVIANIELTLATPQGYTLPLLFADKDQVMYCELDVGEEVRRPYALPLPGQPICPDEKTATTWSVADLLQVIRARSAAGDGAWVTRDASVVASAPQFGIPVLLISGLPPGVGSKGRETTNHGNFRLMGITEVAAPFSLESERQYILSFSFLGIQTPTTTGVTTTQYQQPIELSKIQVYGDQSLLIYGCL